MWGPWLLWTWTLYHGLGVAYNSCPIICISNQIPSIYITVKAVRHLGSPSPLNLFDFAIFGLCLEHNNKHSNNKHKLNAKVGIMTLLKVTHPTVEYKSSVSAIFFRQDLFCSVELNICILIFFVSWSPEGSYGSITIESNLRIHNRPF